MADRILRTVVKIDGEAEYRAVLSRINAELKNLQSNLRLTESQYQTNANTVQALQARHDALSSVMDAQKKKIESLRGALENAKSAQETYAQKCYELREKILNNEEAMAKLKASTGDTSEAQKTLAAETEVLKKQLAEEEAKLAGAEKSVNRWQAGLNDAEIKLNNLDAELQKNDKYLEEAKSSADGCAKSIDQYGNEVKESAEATEKQNDALEALATALAAAGVKAGIDKITEALKACVSASAQFEAGMSAVGAIANATAGEMELLGEKAKEIGASTKYTASEAAGAMEYMALAGWSAQEMLEGVDGVINLAAASGENLATVSDIVTDALTAFGLKAKDSEHFVDVLAKTAASSNTTVTLLGEAFKYAAPLAGALGYSVEDVAVAIGLMANQGIKGSQAGTALRTIFTKLTGDIKLTGEAFGEATVKASYADGSMKPLSQTLQELRGYFNQMTQAEKLSNAEAMAGKYAMSGLTAVMNSTEEDFISLTATIQDCTGAAKTMAEVRMDNLEGQVTLMKSAFDALKIAVGDDLNPALRSLAETGTDVLTWAAKFVEEHEMVVPILASVVAGVTTLTTAMAGFTIFQKVTPLIGAFNSALSSNPIGLVITAVATLTAVMGTLDALLEKESVASVKDLTEAAQGLSGAMDDVHKKTENSVQTTEATAAQATHYVNVLRDMEAAGLDSAESQEAYRQVVEKLNAIMPELNLTIDEQTGLVKGGTDAINAQVDAWKDLATQQALQEQYKGTLAAVAEVESEVWLNKGKLLEAEAKEATLTDELNEKMARQAELDEQIVALLEAGGLKTKEGRAQYAALADEYEKVSDEADTLAWNLENNAALQSNLNEAITQGTDTVAAYQSDVDAAAAALALFNEETAAAAGKEIDYGAEAARALSEDLKTLAADYQDAYDAAKKSLDGQFKLWEEVGTLAEQQAAKIAETQADAWDKAYKSAEQSVSGQFKLFEEAKAAEAGSVEAMIHGMQTQEAYWIEYQNNIDTALNSSVEGAREFVTQFLDGSKDSAAALAAFSSATQSEQQNMVDAWRKVQTAEQDAALQLTELKTQGSEDMAALAEASKLSVEQIIEAQESQQRYWQEYTENLDNLRSRDIEGIDNLVQAYSDGSTQSAEILAVLVNATDEQLTSLVNSSTKTDAMRANIAGTAANLKTDFDAKMKALVKSFEDMVAAMSQKSGEVDFSPFLGEVTKQFGEVGASIYKASEEAGQNADLGLQNGLVLSSGQVYLAANAMGQGILDGVKASLNENSPSKEMEEIGKYAGEGLKLGIDESKEQVKAAAEEMGDVLKDTLREAGSGAVEEYAVELAAIEERTRDAMELARAAVQEYEGRLSGEMRIAGEQMVDGMTEGVYNRSGSLYAAMEAITHEALETARRAADTHSPSKKTQKIFEDVGEGMAVGVEKKRERVAAATKGVVDNALHIDATGMIEATKLLASRKPDIASLTRPQSAADSSAALRSGDVTVNVNMPGMVIREEADIKKISNQIAQDVSFALRQKGRG